jgi:hypothetical protein
MATNYFPAANPYLAPDPSAIYQRLLQIKAAQQQMAYQQQMQPLQLQQQQNVLTEQQQAIKDQQAGQAAWSEWNPKDGYDALAAGMIKHGASVAAAQQVSQFGLNSLKTQSETIKNNADAGKAQVETQKANNDAQAGYFDALNNVPDAQLQQSFNQTIQDGVKSGRIDPQHAQLAQQIGQGTPDQIRQALPYITKSYQAESAQQETALKHAQEREATANAAYKEAENQAIKQYGGMSDQMLDVKYNALAQQQAAGQTLAPNDQAFMQGYEKRKLLVPQFKVDMRPSVAGGQAALANVPPHLVGFATTQATKAGEEYANAVSANQDMQSMIDLARSGNVLSYAYAPTEGVLTLNTARGVKRVNMPEIQSYGGAGSALDRITGYLGKQTSGKSIPDNVLNDMSAVHNQMAQNARTKYQNSLKIVNQNTGANFQPVDLSEGGGGGGPAAGYTRIRASDGSTHDIPTQNLGAAKQIDPRLQVVQ